MLQTRISNSFSSTVLRIAIKRYQQNPKFNQLLKLLSFDDIRIRPSYAEQYRSECRIIHGVITYRMQKAWISNISTSSTFTKVPRLEIRRHLDCETDNAVRICPNEIQQKNIVAAVESHYLRQRQYWLRTAAMSPMLDRISYRFQNYPGHWRKDVILETKLSPARLY
jgi:hypothetical protein